MGVGKGTTARAIVKNSNYFAIDTDDLIESIEKRSVKKIFSEDGEQYFRNLEKNALYGSQKMLITLLFQLVVDFLGKKIFIK